MGELSPQMPLWAILYSGLILASAAGTIMISGRKSPLYILGELLSALFAISFFLFYYEVVIYPPALSIPILMLAFILFQEVWINRELYSFLEMGDMPPQERKFMFGFMAIMMTLFLAPFLWITLSVFKHYFLN